MRFNGPVYERVEQASLESMAITRMLVTVHNEMEAISEFSMSNL